MRVSPGMRSAGSPVRAVLSGVLPVDKPEGPTSHDIVSIARRTLGLRRIGHTGTLDPFASGLLLLCLGPATRLAEYLTSRPKTYTAVMRLGVATDTDDRMGSVIRESDGWRTLSHDAVRYALGAQVGRILQRPPAYSAKRVGGERMYAAARRGEAVEANPVEVTVHRIEVLSLSLPEVEFEVECSSGTYIRAIARDAGETLGVGGHLTALRRTAIGRHSVDRALGPGEMEDPTRVRDFILSPAEALSHMPRAVLSEEEAAAIANGRSVPAPEEVAEHAGQVALLSGDHRLLAVAERRGADLHPRKVFPPDAS